jgi:tetratricopeptide (TPR) repeat protein
MSQLLEDLLEKTNSEPEDLLQLASAFLDTAASTNHDQIIHYHDLIETLFLRQEGNFPFIDPLRFLIDGVANFYLTKYNVAKDNITQAQRSFKTGFPTDILGAIYLVQGAIFRSLGEIDLAVENQFLATETLNKDGYFKISYAYANYQLGEIHVSIGEFDNAQIYYEEALSVILKTDDVTATFRINNALGICFLHFKDFVKSESYLNTALAIDGITAAEKSGGLCDLGILNMKTKEYATATKVLQESLEIRRSNNLEDAASTSLIYLGSAYLKQDDTINALNVLKEALLITKKFNALGKKIKVYRLLSKAYESLGQADTALRYFNEYDTLNNEIRSQQEHKIFRLKNKQIESQKQQVHEKNVQLKATLDELAKVKNSRKSLFFSIGTAITLVILTEAFFDPLIDSYAYNVYLSLGVKVLIALMLKPMESFYERILFRKAMKLKD